MVYVFHPSASGTSYGVRANPLAFTPHSGHTAGTLAGLLPLSQCERDSKDIGDAGMATEEQGMESRERQENGASDSWATSGENSRQPTAEDRDAIRGNTGQSEISERHRPTPPVAALPIETLPEVERTQSQIDAGKIACPWCGATNPDGALRCGACGYRFAVRCHACGATNSKDAANCAYCGQSLRLAPFDTMEIARARVALRTRRLQTSAKGSSGRYRRGVMPDSAQPLSRLFLLLLVTGGAALALLILIVVLMILANGGTF